MDSSHVLTKWPKAFSINNFLKKVIEIQKYDFRTLKLTKNGIFRNWVKGLWNGPCQHLLIGNVFEMLLFDVRNGCYLFLVYLKELFFGQVFFVRHMHGF